MPQAVFLKDVFEFVLLLFSLCVHESAHAWTASLLGDHTARLEGRITLNPAYHVDPVGTLLVPALIIFGPLFGFSLFSGFIIGWAKPTPIITRNFRKIIRDENLVSLAGPAANLLLVLIAFAVLAVMALVLPNGPDLVLKSFAASLGAHANVIPQPAMLLCSLTIFINLSLFFFNLLPIPPLDGSHILRNMLPYGAVQVYDRIGSGWISWILMFFLGGFILNLFMFPTLTLVFSALQHL
ncbi:MAG TPA: site-2 protease family protein [Terracidiphilus sp.]|nr:site-2 protease family protein [Terracidiphilus sp.]